MIDEPEEERQEEAYDSLLPHPELNKLSLYRGGLELEHRTLQELADAWLKELAEEGMPGLDPDENAPLKQADPRRPEFDPQGGTRIPARVGDHPQKFWLRLDGPRTGVGDGGGYSTIVVEDKPLRTQSAIVALVTVLEASKIDVKCLREALSELVPPLLRSVDERLYGSWWSKNLPEENAEPPEKDEQREKEYAWHKNLQLPKLRYVLALLRYYRPRFDNLTHREQLDLILLASDRVNQFLKATRQLVGFLEYGVPNRDLREAAEVANRDVAAKMLTDVEGLNLVEVADRLGIPVTNAQRVKNDASRVREMIKRGKKLLEDAFGEEGWRNQVEAMKAEAKHFRNLSIEEQAVQTLVDGCELEEEARRQIARTEKSRRKPFLLPSDPYRSDYYSY